MSKVCKIQGNVGSEPEMRFTPNGNAVTTFSMAVYDGKDQDGNKKPRWIKVTSWNKLAEVINQKIRKGQGVEVSGFVPEYRFWRDKDSGNIQFNDDGEPKGSYEMNIFSISVKDSYTELDVPKEDREEITI